MNYLRLAAYAAALAALLGFGWYVRHQGVMAERARWEAKAAKDLQTYNDELQRLTAETRAKELAAAERQARADQTYQENLAHAQADRDSALARLRAGTLRLRDPAAVQAHSGADGATAAPGQRDGAERGRLSESTAAALIGIASDADAIAHQLAACQAVVRSDRGE